MALIKKKLTIVRHGETDLNKRRIVQGGGVDSSLNQTGKVQSQAFYNCYKDRKFELVVTSDLQRTYQTVEHFINDGMPHFATPSIREMSWGIHEGKASTPEMHADYQRVNQAWNKGITNVGVMGGETLDQVIERLEDFLGFLKKRPENEILICSHGRTMRILMCILAGDPFTKMDHYKHNNTGVYQLDYQWTEPRSMVLHLTNDTSHLIGWEGLIYD